MPSQNANDLRKKLKVDLFYIMGGCCSICGYDRCIKACEFHHLEKDKKEFSISNYLQKGKELNVLFDEVKKCVMICSNCHRELHDGMHDEKQLVCSFSQERFEEVFHNRRCLSCENLLYNIKTNFCSKSCRGKYSQAHAKPPSVQRKLGKFCETDLGNIDIINVLSRHKGIVERAAAEIGVSGHTLRRRFTKITGHQTYTSYLDSKQ